MSDRNPYEQLGVTEDTGFEEVQAARARLLQQHQDDPQTQALIESAYDTILMERLKMRQEGKIKVPERIRFPEKLAAAAPKFNPVPAQNSPAWLQRLLDSPSTADLLWTSGVFLGLGLVVGYPSTKEPFLSLALAGGLGFSVYFLNNKERLLGRALLLALIALFVGVGIGSIIFDWQKTALLNTGLGEGGKFVTLVTFVFLWLVTTFLR